MTHVAWNCDGKKLAAVGIDKITRVWSPEKSVSSSSFVSLVLEIGWWELMKSLDGIESCVDVFGRTCGRCRLCVVESDPSGSFLYFKSKGSKNCILGCKTCV